MLVDQLQWQDGAGQQLAAEEQRDAECDQWLAVAQPEHQREQGPSKAMLASVVQGVSSPLEMWKSSW